MKINFQMMALAALVLTASACSSKSENEGAVATQTEKPKVKLAKVAMRPVDQVAEYNQLKVLRAMQENQVSEACLLGTTGYGYNDLGRDTLEQFYADSVAEW